MSNHLYHLSVFFFNDTATPEIYTLSLHDALPIWRRLRPGNRIEQHGHSLQSSSIYPCISVSVLSVPRLAGSAGDRKSTRLNSSHPSISYAVFCLKKKNQTTSRHWLTYLTSSILCS